MISSLIAAGASLIGTAMINKRNMKNYYEARHYNTPAAQMARFRQAGLNPHLIYTQTNEADIPPQLQAPDMSALANATGELETFQNIKKSKAETSNLEKTNQMLDQQITGAILDNTLKQIDVKYKDQLTKNQVDLVEKQIENFNKQWSLLEKQIEKVTRETERLDTNDLTDIFNMFTKSKELELAAEKLGLDKSRLQEQIREFNISHRKNSIIDSFLTGLLGSSPNDAAKKVGAALKAMLLAIYHEQFEPQQ